MQLRTVAYSTRTIGIAVASVIAVVLIGSAVVLSGPIPFLPQRANAESTHDLLVAYAAKDTDADGLPDWQEALYGTDPANSHSVNSSMLDGQAVSQGLVKPRFATATSTPVDVNSIPGTTSGPQTITDQFARELFAQYLSQKGGTTPTPEDIAQFVESGVSELSANQVIPNAFNQGQVKVSGTGPDALTTYAADAENAFVKHAIQLQKSEVDYFSDAVNKSDAASLSQVKKIGDSYTATAKAYIAIPAPKEAAVPHLAIANALARLGSDITDMATMQSDPLRAYLGLAKYQNDAPQLIAALTSLHDVYASEQVSVDTGAPGAFFYASLVKASAVKTP